MAVNVPIGSTTYSVPTNGARGWGTDVTTLLVRLSNVANQVVTANYVITTDTFFSDTSGTFGLKSNFLKGVGAIASSDGFIRMASPYANPGQGLSFPSGTPEGKSYTYLSWRNSTNSADLHLYPNNDNVTLQFAGKAQVNVDAAQTISNKILDASNQVNAAALADGSIVDAKIATNAAIQLSKLAAVAVNRLLVSDGTGHVAATAVTNTEAGYLAGVTSAIQTQINTKLTTNTVVNNFRDFAAGVPAGFYTSNAVGIWSARYMTAGSSKLSVTDGGGIAGNPTFDVVEANLGINNIGGQLNATKIADGSVSSTSFQYLSGATSNLQTQINAKLTSNPRIANLAANTTSGYIAYAGADTYLALTAVEVRDAVSPLTTKGDIWVRNATTNARLPVGTNGYILSADSAQGTGLNWVPNSGGTFTASSTDTLTNKTISGASNTLTNIPTTALTGTVAIANGGTAATSAGTAYTNLSEGVAGTPTKGDIFARTTAAMGRVPVGTDGQVLTADAASTSGVKWAAASAGSGSGEKNYIGNPNNATNWVASSAAVTVATETNATLLPDNSTQTTGLRVTRVSGTTDYVRYRFTLDKADYNKKLKIQKDIAYAGSAGDYTIQVFSNTLANYTGTSTQLVVSPTGALPGNTTGQVIMSFDSSGSTAPYIEVRIVAVAGTTPIYFNNFLVGPGVIGQVPAVGPTTAYAPTLSASFGTTTPMGFWYKQTGNSIEIGGKFQVGTTTAAAASFSLPNGWTVDTVALGNTTENAKGKWTRNNGSATAPKSGPLLLVPATNAALVYFSIAEYTIATNPLVAQNANAFSASGDVIVIDGLVLPISQLAGSGTLNSGAGAQVEYLYNLGTFGTTNTTSFGYGPQGAQIVGPLTNEFTYTIRSSTPMSATDMLALEFASSATGPWFNHADYLSAGSQAIEQYDGNASGAATAGASIRAINTTDIQVVFGRYQTNEGTANVPWPSSGIFWRVRKFNASSPVGFGLATATDSGLVSKQEEGSFSVTATGAVTGTFAIAYTKVGRNVTLTFPSIISGGSGAAQLVLTGLPTRMFPANTLTAFAVPVSNSGTLQPTFGGLAVQSGGLIAIGVTGPSLATFANAGNQGLNPCSVTYVSAT